MWHILQFSACGKYFRKLQEAKLYAAQFDSRYDEEQVTITLDQVDFEQNQILTEELEVDHETILRIEEIIERDGKWEYCHIDTAPPGWPEHPIILTDDLTPYLVGGIMEVII